jgi:hypothetical protein
VLQPAKDGAVYLFDADHLGTLYDRAQIMTACGEGSGNCTADWAGTIATKPLIVQDGAATLALVPTFVYDDLHPAGLQALEIRDDGAGPHLVPRWQAPAFSDAESTRAFRRAPSGVTVVDVAGQLYAAVVDVGPAGGAGTLYWIRVHDGQIVQRVALAGPGQRYAPPLYAGGTLYLPSCLHTGSPSFNEGPSVLEAYALTPPPPVD